MCGYWFGDRNRVEKLGGWGKTVIVCVHCISMMNGGVLSQTPLPQFVEVPSFYRTVQYGDRGIV